MVSLLEKFKAVKVSASSLISEADRAFVDKTESEFQAVLENFKKWEQVLKNGTIEIGDRGYYSLEKEYLGKSRGRYYSVGEGLSPEMEKSKWHDHLFFSHAFGLKYIEETREHAAALRNLQIIEYFNETYNLTVDDRLIHELKTPEKVIEYVIHCNKGMSLIQAGEENIISDFRHCFREAEILKNKITFPSSKWCGNYSYQFNDTNKLVAAISLFETQSIKPMEPIATLFPHGMAAGTLYSTPTGMKCTGFKYYKNRKREIHFTDNSSAQEFYDLFRLHDKEIKR